MMRYVVHSRLMCGYQMDVDSEDDQMMRAIALSLGQNVSSAETEVITLLS